MIITHTVSEDGHRRIYLGVKLSIECWLEPHADGKGWGFHYDTCPGAIPMPPSDLRRWAAHVLMQLCHELNVAPDQLAAIPFDVIAALHAEPVTHHRRIPTPKRHINERGFMSTTPNVTRPSADYRARDFDDRQRQRQR